MPADLTAKILNFGLPGAPSTSRFRGADLRDNYDYAATCWLNRLRARARYWPMW
ncbi:hypothetical protein ACOZ4Y_04950 [Komagataeibacter rhaeticus]